MHCPALLYTCILSTLGLIDGIPIFQDNFKSLVKLQADTIIHRIKENNGKLELSPTLIIGHPVLEDLADKPIQGLGSIVDTLTTIQKVLQKLSKENVRQLHSDVPTLLGYFKQRMTIMRCTPKEPANWKSLDTLSEYIKSHPITVKYFILDILKQFMQKLIGNLDQLKGC